MPEPSSGGVEAAAIESDGRRRRGQERRRSLVDAALAVISRDGLSAVTQRSIAAQAGVPPSAVYYYFATLDDLVAAALVQVNDRFIAQLDGIDATGDNPLRALAVVLVEAARPGRDEARAELELWILAARDDRLRSEIDRYNDRLRATAARFSADPTVVDAIAVALTGYYWQVATSNEYDADQLEAILRHIAR
jgi:DNA-binding transcriptional regulator YbjK